MVGSLLARGSWTEAAVEEEDEEEEDDDEEGVSAVVVIDDDVDVEEMAEVSANAEDEDLGWSSG